MVFQDDFKWKFILSSKCKYPDFLYRDDRVAGTLQLLYQGGGSNCNEYASISYNGMPHWSDATNSFVVHKNNIDGDDVFLMVMMVLKFSK